MSNSFLDSLEIGLDGNVAAQDGASTASADPIGAIERVALQKGINPDHLIGLAKLETRLGDATIKGDGQDTYNLFNIKDFSKDGTGIRARDKAEGSNDRYRKYGSYEESAQDLIGLLERRYPAALNASTPEEFAKALKAGGYATDPSYVQKLTRTIGSNSTPGAGAQNGGKKAEGASFLDALSTDDILNLSLNGSDGLVESAFKPIKDRTGGQMAGDLALGLTQGGIGAIKSLTDLAGADNSASAWLDDASKGLQSAKSEYAQQTAANSQKRIEDAKGQGTMAEVGAYLDAIWDAPLDMTAQAAGSLLPFLFTGVAGAGAKALGMANAAKKAGVAKEVFLKSPAGQMAAKEIAKTVGGITSKANIGMGIGMGLGGVKGQQYETTLKEAKAKGLSDEEAKNLATEAQAYGGSMGGTLQQLGGAALGGIGAATGPLERALSRIPSATQPGRGIIGRTLVGGLKEAAPEGMQGAQQAWAGNEAAVGAGVMDASRRFEGVAGQGTQEAVLSFPMGGVAGALEAGPAPQPAPQKPPSTPVTPPPAAPTPPQTPPPAAPASAAPVAQPTAPSAPADPQMVAMSDADLNALIDAIDATDDDAVTDEQWSQYALAITEANRRAAATPPAAPTAPTENAAALAPLPTYMPGIEISSNRERPKQPKVVLQNRDRSGAASVLQMANIAANPDFLRVGPSTEMTTGAPVVFGDLPANAITGRPETVVDGRGDRIQAQYAVVDAGDLIPSNNADGTSVQAYENGLPGKLRAVAGNGRTAGIQKAYQQGTADQYRQDLIENAQAMGLDANAIRGMQKPVLVRVMDAADVRDDMGDRTNISGTQRLSPVEQAANDGAMPPEFDSFEAKTWLLISSPELVGADNKLNERGQAIARTPWSELSVQDRELVTKLSKAKQSASDAYNTYVQKQEKDAERRRLQGDNIIQQANGKPFKTETSAQAKLDEFDLADTHAIQKTDKGFVLRRMPPAEQAERRRKAEGRESYMEAQSAVLAEMGIGETADGEIDATDEQFAEIDRRTAERLGRNAQPADSKPNQPPAQSQQAQAATENVAQQSPQDFIPAPDGGLDYGEITPDMGKAMRMQAGKIRLQHGVQNADGTGWGLVHIEARHGKEIRSAGFESVEQFLADAFRNVDEVWKPGSTSQLIAVQSGRTGKIAFVQLEADRQGGKDFYRINSAFPANEKYVARKERKEGWKPLWSRYPVPADASGASGFVGQSPEAGETTPTVSGQSGATSVPPTDAAAQPITRADVEAAKQQAAAIIGARIDAMTADEVKRIARGFLPSMGLKPSPSKKVNKASMTSAKINLMAAADEVGATLPAEVTRALQAVMEGRVVDVAQDDGITKPAAQAQAETPTPAEPNPLEHTPKQYADAWLRWSAETNGLPLAEVREMQGDEAGLKAIEQRWVDAVVNQAKSGQSLQAKTLDKLLEIRPNMVLPESAIPAGYQRPEARKSEKEEAQARADSRRAAKQGSAPADASLEEIFTGLDSNGLPKAQATEAAKAHPQADLIEQVNSQFHDLLLDLMETHGVLEVNGQTTETEDNKSCL